MIKALEKYKLENIVFLDIETAPLVAELEVDSDLFEAWSYFKRRGGEELTDKELVEMYSKEAGLYPEFARIVVISVGRADGGELRLKSYNNPDEVQLLKEFNSDLKGVMEALPKTVLCGHAAVGFDIPFIMKRCVANQVKPHQLIDNAHLKPWEVPHLDTKDLWKSTSWYPASLISIAVACGIPSPKDDISGSDVGQLYHSGEPGAIDRITRYCEKDVFTTANVFQKLRFDSMLTVSEEEPETDLASAPIILRLFNGGEFGKEEKEELKALLKSLSEEERSNAFDILDSICSNARGKKTNIKKSDVTALRKLKYGK